MKKQTALIIDDEKDICILLGSYLKNREIRTDCAFSLGEGFDLLSRLRPSLLFLDNNLPDGSGIDNIPMIRSLHPEVRIIVISAMSQLRELALSRGADEFIDKPISFEDIVEVLGKRSDSQA